MSDARPAEPKLRGGGNQRAAVAAWVLVGFAALVAVAVLAFHGGDSAAAACRLSVTYLGARFDDAAPLTAGVEGPVGPATVTPCIDFTTAPIPQPQPQPQPTTVRRVAGVAPRFAVAFTDGGLRRLLIAEGVPCSKPTAVATLACLQRRTRQLRTGPALMSPVSAYPRAVIRIAVRAAPDDPTASIGIDTRMQRWSGTRWEPAYVLLYALPGEGTDPPEPVADTPSVAFRLIGLNTGPARPVKLPDAPSGLYRLSARLGAKRHVTAVIRLVDRPAGPPCEAGCVHG